jgi:predicted nucleotidyltransferase
MVWWLSESACDALVPADDMFEEIIRALTRADIRFVVIGGVAATVQGSARLTNDIDICYDTSPDNVDRLVTLLQDWNAYLRGVERGLPFILDARAFRTTPLMTLTTDVGDIDVLDMVPGVGDYRAVLAASERVTIGDAEFRSLSLEALIASKRAVRRPKDLEQLIELEAILALRRKSRQQGHN